MRSILLFLLVARMFVMQRALLKIVGFSLGMGKYVVCLCRECDVMDVVIELLR